MSLNNWFIRTVQSLCILLLGLWNMKHETWRPAHVGMCQESGRGGVTAVRPLFSLNDSRMRLNTYWTIQRNVSLLNYRPLTKGGPVCIGLLGLWNMKHETCVRVLVCVTSAQESGVRRRRRYGVKPLNLALVWTIAEWDWILNQPTERVATKLTGVIMI